MKSVISASLIFIFIIVMIFVSGIYVNRLTDEMLQSLYKNENYIAKNDWKAAVAETEYVILKWNKNRHLISTLFNHSYIDKIETSIAKIKNAVQMQEKEDFIYEKVNLELLLLNLKEQQKISIGNIF